MDHDDNFRTLHYQINVLKDQANTIKADVTAHPEKASSDVFIDTLEELSTSLEELQITQEELYIQHEELLDARQDLETERWRYADLFELAPDGYLVTDLKGVIREVNRAARLLLNIRPDHLVGKPLSVFLLPEDRVRFFNYISERLQYEAHSTEWEVQLQPRKADPVFVLIKTTVVREPNGKPVALRWLLRDITQRKQIEQQIRDLNANLEERVRARTEELVRANESKDEALIRERAARLETDALRETGMILSSTFDVGEVLKRILSAVGSIVQHDAADIVLLEDGELSPACCHGYSHCNDIEFISGLHFPVQSLYPLNEIARTRSPIMLSPVPEPLIWVKHMDGDSEIQSYLGVPIYVRSEVIGFINLTSRTPNYFSNEHIRLLELFSIQAAFAIQNARAHEDVQALLRLEERNRLARDLHDAVSQSLFTASIIAETLQSTPQDDTKSTDELLSYLVRLTRGAQAEMRNLLLELRPAHLTGIDLPSALRRLADATWARKDVHIHLDLHMQHPMPDDVQMAFYRIAQEALNNVVKHAHADNAMIKLVSDGEVAMTISDDGRGFDPDHIPKDMGMGMGMGMGGMQERAHSVNAELTVTSAPGRGTQVSVRWKRDAA